MILEIDEDRRRLSLGMKQCKPNPWDDFASTHAKGDNVSGQIKSITDFGVFIGLPGNIDGLVHLSDLSWSQTGEEAIRTFKKGDELQAVILAIDVEKERISLGVKQLSEDPTGGESSASDSDTAGKPKAKAKNKAEKQTAEEAAAASGNTNLGALLKAKMDNKK